MADKTFTLVELSEFDGIKNDKIYIALNYKVYDVTEIGKAHYGKGGQYSMFAGKDISRAMAMMQMKTPDTFDDLADLTQAHKDSLQAWVKTYDGKYPVVGKLVR